MSIYSQINVLYMFRDTILFLIQNEACLEFTRKWLTLFIGIIASYIAIQTFKENLKQRKLENTFKMLDYMRKHINNEQIETFKVLFKANIVSSECAGTPNNEFHFDNLLIANKHKNSTFEDTYPIDYIENMFSEGGCGNGDIANMIEIFNLISKYLNEGKLIEGLIWYKYGQLLITCYKWTKYLDEKNDFRENEITFYNEFNKFMKNVEKNNLSVQPTKMYVYLE
ncbi:MAG: hypothetical protein LH461_11645 [Spirochaetaceae bacterium]|nr:hypothetical protein [Spirochaetaceae bacterium]